MELNISYVKCGVINYMFTVFIPEESETLYPISDINGFRCV